MEKQGRRTSRDISASTGRSSAHRGRLGNAWCTSLVMCSGSPDVCSIELERVGGGFQEAEDLKVDKL